MDRTDGHPNIVMKRFYGMLFGIRHRLGREIEIRDGSRCYRFRCDNLREYARCVKMFVKEPGTCTWIQDEMHSGEVFYDIGANIGVYTVLAAYQVGEGGRVFAFEPHSANFAKLLEHIALNRLQSIVVPCNMALHSEEGFFPFNYFSTTAGHSHSQLSGNGENPVKDYTPEVSELKYAASIDTMIASGSCAVPDHIKIDVDGNELAILRGMSGLLSSEKPPKSIQVEMATQHEAAIVSFMEEHRYLMGERHYTRAVQKCINKGKNLKKHYYNGIFRKARR
jgi:FkbM family methyltransferase